jgi:hypothetical protein
MREGSSPGEVVGPEPTPELVRGAQLPSVQILAGCVVPRSAMTFFVGTKVRFIEKYKPPQVRWGAIGTTVDMEERPAPNSGSDYWARARFGDFPTPWIAAWQSERVS